MEHINHYTLNTGSNRRSVPSEVDKEIFFTLKRILSDARKKGKAEILDGTFIELTEEGSAYAITLFKEVCSNKVPLLLTCGCRDKADASKVLKIVNDFYKSAYGKNPIISPICPFCMDIILPYMLISSEIMSWTGDFCKCMAWTLLAPEMIR